MRTLKTLALAAGALTLVACAEQSAPVPEPTTMSAPAPAPEPAPVTAPTIVDIAVGNPDFSTLVAALTAADLVGTLSGPGPFTVFAPTNAAFAALPAGTVENLLLPENKDQLVAILTYHVLPARVTAAEVPTELTSVGTVAGKDLAVLASATGVTVNTATVTTADIEASNGVIHVIDQVLLPKAE